MSTAALLKEKESFRKVKELLPKGTKIISRPSGFSNEFPDFGFTVTVGDMKMNLYFEYKSDYKAQMGWIRDWSFDGFLFSSNSALKDDDKMQLLNIMNASSESLTSAKTMLKALQKYYSKNVQELNSSSLGVLEKNDRYLSMVNLLRNIDNFNIANVSDDKLGKILLEYFKRKYKNISLMKKNTDYSALFIMIKDEIWLIADNDERYRELLPILFKTNKEISEMKNLNLQLEIRIQTKPGREKILGNPDVYIKGLDPIAAYRMKTKPSNGCKII